MSPALRAGILLKPETTTAEALECYAGHAGHNPAFIHAGFADAKRLVDELQVPVEDQCHIFFDRFCGKLYQKHFKGAHRVLLKDGFDRKRNKDYDPVEPFSDLHATFQDEGMNGFGDFLIVGDEYSESGGPAYAVAIHLTFIDPGQDDAMFVYHFISTGATRQKTPQASSRRPLRR